MYVCHRVHTPQFTQTSLKFATKPFLAFSNIHDLRVLQLAVHRLAYRIQYADAALSPELKLISGCTVVVVQSMAPNGQPPLLISISRFVFIPPIIQLDTHIYVGYVFND